MEDATGFVLDYVRAERKHQDEKWGSQRGLSDGTWSLILMEEVGEACEAALEYDDDMFKELIQVAAVAVAWAECLLERKEASLENVERTAGIDVPSASAG